MTTRRDALKALALAPIAAITWTRQDVERAAEYAATEQSAALKFFTPQEWRTIRVLVDDIIPADSRSGSATSAKVPEFMDFILSERSAAQQTAMHAGLGWVTLEMDARHGRPYEQCTVAQRQALLDEIAWPAKAAPAFRQHATWFNSIRDLTAAGFFSSRVGWGDLKYTGNVFVAPWKGSSPEIIRKLGVSYDEWDKKYGRGF
jgi:gluconate 2-dehydrogenase gamma chain